MDDDTRSEVEARRARILDEVGPRTEVGAILVERIAVLSVRLERATRFDEEALLGRVRHAFDDFDDARTVEVEGLYRRLVGLVDLESAEAAPADDSPPLLVRKLRRSAEGVDRLSLGLREVVARLDDAERRRDALPRLSRLVDLIDGQSPWSRDASDESETAGAIRRRAEVAMGRLESARDAIDPALREADRRGAPVMALFDPSRAGELARRYEARAERALFRAIDDLRLAEPAIELEPLEAPPAPAPLPKPAASRPAPAPAPTPRPTIPRPHLSIAEPDGASSVDVSAGRAAPDLSDDRAGLALGVDLLPDLPSWFVPEPGMDVDHLRRVYARALAQEFADLDQMASA